MTSPDTKPGSPNDSAAQREFDPNRDVADVLRSGGRVHETLTGNSDLLYRQVSDAKSGSPSKSPPPNS